MTKNTDIRTLVVLIFIDGVQFSDFLLDGTKKMSVGFSGADNLEPGDDTGKQEECSRICMSS